MVEADEREGEGGTYPIQGPQGNCNATTACEEENAVSQDYHWYD